MPQQRKDIDIRSDNDGDPSWILFLARNPDPAGGSATGHCFIAFAQEDAGQSMSWQKGFGLHPKEQIDGGASLLFGIVPGGVIPEKVTTSDFVLSCRVGRAQFEAARAVRDAWIGSGYELMFRDCVTFCLAIAKAIGLNLPSRENGPEMIYLPIRHINRLSDLNDTGNVLLGGWSSLDEAARWRLDLAVGQARCTERSAAGETIETPVTVTQTAPRRYKIERENNAEVLDFLGARETVRDALLAHGVRPSYLVMSRSGDDNCVAAWHGLRWTLTAEGALDQVIQPDEGPAIPYDFRRKT